MRLLEHEVNAIRHAVKESFGPQANVWLFGSRVDDTKKGGDIDLLINPSAEIGNKLQAKLQCLRMLEQEIGERKIDIVIESQGDPRPIVRLAHETGVLL